MQTLEQGTQEWLNWRHKGIGASDVPVIMGVSPYKKAYTLWEEKISPTPPVQQQDNFILNKGNRLEPIARAKAELELGISFKPTLVESATKKHLLCSLDGLSEDGKTFIEIKYVGKEFHNEVPEKYNPQVQYQYALTGAEQGYYVQINDEEKIKILPIVRDIELIKVIMKKVDEFWKMVVDKEFKIDKELKALIQEFSHCKYSLDLFTEKCDELKKKIYELTPAKFSYDFFSISTVNKAGEIDYKKIVEEKLKDLDLEPFRKNGTSFKQIRIK